MRFSILLLTVILGASQQLFAHAMDAASLKISVQENRAVFDLKIHELAAENLTKNKLLTADEIFAATLKPDPPILNNEVCEWRTPGLLPKNEDAGYLTLEVVAVCGLARVETHSFQLHPPFLNQMPIAFKMLTTVSNLGEAELNFILTNKVTSIDVNADAMKHQSLFLQLGFSHIWPEGTDHILFILALVLTGAGFISVVKNATGFTLGHTLSLGLATFQIIHVHSFWVEALIALSITLLVAVYFWKSEIKHGFFLNTALGTLHGLGFASIIHDLQLSKDALLPALLSFNLGIELAQVCIIVVATLFLMGLKRLSPLWHARFKKASLVIIFFVSFYWFLERAIV